MKPPPCRNSTLALLLLGPLAARVARIAGLAAVLLPLSLASAQAERATRPHSPPGQPSWQRQQPTRARTQRLFRREGIAQSPGQRRKELRSLNQINRELMPPGAVGPAPGLGAAGPR